MNPVILALIVTAVGMGLVFLSILLLWGLMSLLLRIAPEKPTSSEVSAESGANNLELAESQSPQARRRLAAAIGVAVALARQVSHEPREFPLPQTALVSAWQAVMRSEMLRKRGPR